MTVGNQGPEETVHERSATHSHVKADLLELRIALVCYGGVSLAIYMHGVTKELQSLLRASRAFDQAFASAATPDDLARSPSRPADGTEAAYFDQLVELAGAGVPVSATVDVIAGTSAGGINGICLAKAAVRNASQDPLTDLWMQKGDIAGLMRYGRLGARLGGAWTVLQLLGKAREAWSPLKGDDMARWLHEALADMGNGGGSGTLLPDDGTLDLHVTATDVRGTDRMIPLGRGEALHDRTYRRVFTFQHGPDVPDTIGEGDHGMLAFAARATSSFPGAFAPVTLDEFAKAVHGSRGQTFDPAEAARAYLPEYDYLPDVDATHVPMMDGGVLANAPFDPVVESIAAKPASRQVSRHLLFVEPDPRAASPGSSLGQAHGGQSRDEGPPTWVGTLWAAQGARGHQPLTGAIERLGEFNDQVDTIGEVISSLRDDVELALERVGLAAASAAQLTFEQLASRAGDVYAEVPGIAGQLNYRVYGRLKMEKVSARLAEDLAEHLTYPKTSPEASFLHAGLLAWTQLSEAWASRTEGAMDEWLRGLDAPYRERRLEFLIDGINSLFNEATKAQLADGGTAAGPTREQLSSAKTVAWDLLVQERSKPAQAVRQLGDVAEFARREALSTRVFTEDPRAWAKEHQDQIEQLVAAYRKNLEALTADSAQRLCKAFTETTADWGKGEARLQLASRYAGFPLWDALLFPAQSLSRLPMLNPIRVSRISPVDASSLMPADEAADKLLGVSFAHFSAFFALKNRENDYLWGRLDGAELILRLLREQYESRRSANSQRLKNSDEIQRAAFATVLDQEQPRLKERDTQERITDLRGKVPSAMASR